MTQMVLCEFVMAYGEEVLMPAGLQCWDERGRLIVDLRDYNTRYVGSVSGTIDATAPQLFIPYSAATLSGCFGVIVSTKSNSQGYAAFPYEFSARAINGGIQIIRVGGAKNVTLTVDVYAFI
ncbi:hypothetical protein LU226_00215 [Pantoea sp. Pb-8]|uniref:hypothetical protein n=1 Tax=Pantoea sp. Pb-8 TaxID=2904118 RepID=UPI001E4665AF|nr:hypothetical protein [Pantoea sp. Pb-8]MCE0499839.1 hypothetical protein [Pantoea sp. Pb-8]